MNGSRWLRTKRELLVASREEFQADSKWCYGLDREKKQWCGELDYGFG